jgi:hypothetical protein
MEKFLNRYLHNHQEAKTDVTDNEKMIADLTLLLGDAERTKESLKHSRVMKMSFKQTLEHLTTEDEHYIMTKANNKLASSSVSSIPSNFRDAPPPNYDQGTPVSMYANKSNNRNNNISNNSNNSNSNRICWHYADTGTCSHGDNCRFKHDNGAVHNNNDNMGCSICYSTDHWPKNCPNFKKKKSFETCSICKINGHLAKDCPMKQSSSRDRNEAYNKRSRSSSPYQSNQRYTPTSAIKNASPLRPGTPHARK